MAIKNQRIGGTDYSDPARIKPDDLNDTFDRFANALVESTVTFLEGINFNTELAQNNSITDKSYTYASTDVFTDSNGYNDTVDTGNTTALYDEFNNIYGCKFTDEASGDTTHDPNSFTNPSNAFDNDDSTYAEKSTRYQAALGKTFSSSKHISTVYLKTTHDIPSSYSADISLTLQTYDGTSWNTEYKFYDVNVSNNEQSVDGYFILNKTVQGIRARFYSQQQADYTRLYSLEYGDGEDSIIQLNSKTFSNITNASSLLLTAKNNGLGDVTYDVSSDGGSTYEKTGQNIREVVGLDGDNNQIKIKINLNKGSNGESPKVPGYAYQVWEN